MSAQTRFGRPGIGIERRPYPGLRAFRRDEADLFFGRDEQIDALLDQLAESRFLAVLGTSGSGKSSLVRAGLLPALDGGVLLREPDGPLMSKGPWPGTRWSIAELRPGERPFEHLARALLEDTGWGGSLLKRYGSERASDPPPPADADAGTRVPRHEAADPVPRLVTDLRRGGQALGWLLGVAPLPPGERLLILVDQFEELFRYHRSDSADAAAFVALLLGAVAHPDCHVVITLRSEFLGHCARYPDLPEAINAGLFLTPRLRPAELADAIAKPPRLAAFRGQVERDLVRALLKEASYQQDRLPLLQHVLMRLWDRAAPDATPDAKSTRRLTTADLEDLGGMRAALDSHAEEAFRELNPDPNWQPDQPLSLAQRTAEQLFRALTERTAGGEDVRRPVSVREAAEAAGVGTDALLAAAAPFRRPDRSFLMPPLTENGVRLGPDERLDITHEALIRQWRRLQDWTENEAKQAELYQRLAAAALRHERGEGALWIDPDLQIALNWLDNHHPTEHWAERYGGNFALAMGFLDASREARDARRAAEEEQRRREIRLVRERTESLFDSGLTHAALLARVEDSIEAREVLRGTAKLDKDIAASRRHARNLLSGYVDILGGTADNVYEGAGAALTGGVTVSPDGRLLAAAGERGTLVLFDAKTGELLRRLEGHDPSAPPIGAVSAVVFAPAGDVLYSGGDDRRIIRWSVPVGEKLGEWAAPGQVFTLALSPDGETLLSGGHDDGISLWSAATGEKLRDLKGQSSSIADGNALAFFPDGRRLIGGSYKGDVGIWDRETGTEQVLPRLHTERVNAVAVSPDGKRIATGGADKHIDLWDAASGQHLRPLRGHENIVFDLAFDADGGRLLSVSRDNDMRLWDVETGVTLQIYQGHSAGLWSVARHGGTLYTAANDATLRRWSLATPGQWICNLPGEPASVAFHPNGDFVSVGFADGALRVYALPDAEGPPDKPLAEIRDAHDADVQRQTFSPNGNLLATAGFDNTAKLWGIERGAAGPTLTLVRTLEGHRRSVHAVAFSPDGRTLTTAGYDGQVGLFDMDTGESRLFGSAFTGRVGAVEFDPTGNRLMSVNGDDRIIRFWDIHSDLQKPVIELPKLRDIPQWASLSPDGRQLAAVGRDQFVTLYDLDPNSAQPRRLVGHESTVFRAIYSPDGTQLATVSADMTVRLWDLTTGKALFVLRLPTISRKPSPLWDFDFRCLPAGHCWIAVPLTMGRLALYRLPYRHPPASLSH